MGQHYEQRPKGAAVFDEAKRWDGWGTALKPAHEPIAFARKPFRGAVRDVVQQHGTGALNIDAARVGNDVLPALSSGRGALMNGLRRSDGGQGAVTAERHGRWPANVITDGSVEVLEAFPPSARDAIRFFYCPKADKAEREFGLSGVKSGVGALRDGSRGSQPRANAHPTVKPIDLMRWLARLTTAPTGVVLDPFMGSGSTGIAAVREGLRFVGIEQSPEYFEIACQRIGQAVDHAERSPDIVHAIDKAVARVRAEQFAMAI